MPSKDDILAELTSKLMDAMVDDIVMDIGLKAHHEIVRSRAVCHICHTRCNSIHVPRSSSQGHAASSSSRIASPSAEPRSVNGPSGTGTSTPTNGKNDVNIYFECANCTRQIASNRYATHLSSCMGIGTRKGAARGATNKVKVPSELGRSTSPFFGSDNGNMSDDNKNSKAKGKSKSKRVDEAEFNLNRKRPGSPMASPSKKQKKQPGSGSPVGRAKAEPDASTIPVNSSNGSQSKVPSRLRESSTASFLEPSRSRSSSVDSRSSASTPTSSAISARSPSFVNGSSTTGKKSIRAKPPSPPRIPAPIIRVPEPDYLVDVEGDETGSSTDSDSS
ncbi:hypothetical protein JAAARDRAFT_37833 [Jaapia argillacea MUCL 33604]|uniref:SAGA-associated factor 11 n=1 Tax=Jaapia argillacea MUCL 33604 TaxID=933084 RepID=A0A067PIU6_9AGAM|nr:hypothetical protein JAAARDRAFT_37833 [Jaapia argillacea MUCL 33604]